MSRHPGVLALRNKNVQEVGVVGEDRHDVPENEVLQSAHRFNDGETLFLRNAPVVVRTGEGTGIR